MEKKGSKKRYYITMEIKVFWLVSFAFGLIGCAFSIVMMSAIFDLRG